jgi:mannose-6-phosphate isomerase-like protein (cupin superfamily)
VEVVSRDSSLPFVTKDRSEIRSILDRTNSTARNLSLAEATVPVGTETEAHYHPQAEEIYYVLGGRGLITLGDERREVGPGDGILIPPETRHKIRNIAQTPLVILCCCAPPYSHQDTILLVDSGGG